MTERICTLCDEPMEVGEKSASLACEMHRECGLRSVVGGIGHLIDHAHFCAGVGPDAGLDYRTSALLVDVFILRKGVHALQGS